jgi:hypothetical protein
VVGYLISTCVACLGAQSKISMHIVGARSARAMQERNTKTKLYISPMLRNAQGSELLPRVSFDHGSVALRCPGGDPSHASSSCEIVDPNPSSPPPPPLPQIAHFETSSMSRLGNSIFPIVVAAGHADAVAVATPHPAAFSVVS